jgi:hypothetical protein
MREVEKTKEENDKLKAKLKYLQELVICSSHSPKLASAKVCCYTFMNNLMSDESWRAALNPNNKNICCFQFPFKVTVETESGLVDPDMLKIPHHNLSSLFSESCFD